MIFGSHLGGECELRDPSDHGGVVRMRDVDLTSEEVTTHLESGKQATKVGIGLETVATFVVSEDLTISKLKLSDNVMDKLESSERDSVEAELMARFFLNASAIATIYGDIETAFKVSSS